MFCVQPRTFISEDEEAPADCSWSVIAHAIRLHALGKSLEEAVDLNGWANLIDGIAELESRQGP